MPRNLFTYQQTTGRHMPVTNVKTSKSTYFYFSFFAQKSAWF